MIVAITVLAGISAIITGRYLSARPALFDTVRLPSGMRFTTVEMQAVAAVLRFAGWAALVGLIIATIAQLTGLA
ncbi:hypothetical protein [Aminobacter sp. AP02]|uniref:hypothetical protein n=1 Tax=Aminobacter sp. AP02 TaxID=2135737 RepID=UPI000D6C4484|nr:hypothetical protein [Aminobacter sp. AP02]PWK64634.1 hypothetical protein C8K44_11975 [Aminobacter sp. AP02]